jgi:hypothetical protein
MIFSEFLTGKEMLLSGWLCKSSGRIIEFPKPSAEIGFCTCEFLCDYGEDAWVYPTDSTDSYRNDYRAILITLLDPLSTYTFELVDSTGAKTPLADVTHGELFPLGFNTVQPLKVGFRVDWLKVYNSLGLGSYKIKVTQTDYGTTTESLSHSFHVRVFDECASNLTVKIETVQSGIILNGEDYGGMNWYNMVRVRGTFGAMAPQYEIDRLVDSSRQDIDIQTTKYNKYSLSTELLPDFIGDILTDDTVLTDEIFISVNDIWNYKQYRRLPVTFEGSVEAGEDYRKNNRKTFNITLKDRKSKLKRNFV